MSAKNSFYEGTNVIATVNFRADGAAFPPNTVHWTLRNETADAEVVALTSVTAADSVEISISAAYITIHDGRNKREKYSLTVFSDYGLATQIPEVVKFWVTNISALS